VLYFLLKTLVSALIIVTISEIAKRSTAFGALIASLPLTSLLSFIWIYIDGGDVKPIIKMSYEIFWLVIPSLVFFLIFPYLLSHNSNFWLALLSSSLVVAICYMIGLYLL
jgi:hypothetical protein